MPKCKYCNVELEIDDIIDDYIEDPKILLKEDGHCPKCHKNYIWFDVFVYSDFTGLKECD